MLPSKIRTFEDPKDDSIRGFKMVMGLKRHYFEYFLMLLGTLKPSKKEPFEALISKWIKTNYNFINGKEVRTEEKEKCFVDLWRCMKL